MSYTTTLTTVDTVVIEHILFMTGSMDQVHPSGPAFHLAKKKKRKNSKKIIKDKAKQNLDTIDNRQLGSLAFRSGPGISRVYVVDSMEDSEGKYTAFNKPHFICCPSIFIKECFHLVIFLFQVTIIVP